MIFTLVSQGPNHIRYLATGEGSGSPDSGTIQHNGAGDADVALEDAVVAGPLKEVIDTAVANTAQARRLLMDDGLADAAPNISNVPKRAICQLTHVSGTADPWLIDVDEDGSGNVEIDVQGPNPGTAYIDILFRHSLTQQ